jgi:hypothetical protein
MPHSVSRRFFCLGSLGLVCDLFLPNYSICAMPDDLISKSLSTKIPGCSMLTWGNATTDGTQGGVYIPRDPGVYSNIIVMARAAEAFVAPRLDREGLLLDGIVVHSFYRPPEIDEKLSPGSIVKAHSRGMAIDFSVGGCSAGRLGGILKAWPSGLGLYSSDNFVHLDIGTSYPRRWRG